MSTSDGDDSVAADLEVVVAGRAVDAQHRGVVEEGVDGADGPGAAALRAGHEDVVAREAARVVVLRGVALGDVEIEDERVREPGTELGPDDARRGVDRAEHARGATGEQHRLAGDAHHLQAAQVGIAHHALRHPLPRVRGGALVDAGVGRGVRDVVVFGVEDDVRDERRRGDALGREIGGDARVGEPHQHLVATRRVRDVHVGDAGLASTVGNGGEILVVARERAGQRHPADRVEPVERGRTCRADVAALIEVAHRQHHPVGIHAVDDVRILLELSPDREVVRAQAGEPLRRAQFAGAGVREVDRRTARRTRQLEGVRRRVDDEIFLERVHPEATGGQRARAPHPEPVTVREAVAGARQDIGRRVGREHAAVRRRGVEVHEPVAAGDELAVGAEDAHAERVEAVRHRVAAHLFERGIGVGVHGRDGRRVAVTGPERDAHLAPGEAFVVLVDRAVAVVVETVQRRGLLGDPVVLGAAEDGVVERVVGDAEEFDGADVAVEHLPGTGGERGGPRAGRARQVAAQDVGRVERERLRGDRPDRVLPERREPPGPRIRVDRQRLAHLEAVRDEAPGGAGDGVGRGPVGVERERAAAHDRRRPGRIREAVQAAVVALQQTAVRVDREGTGVGMRADGHEVLPDLPAAGRGTVVPPEEVRAAARRVATDEHVARSIDLEREIAEALATEMHLRLDAGRRRRDDRGARHEKAVRGGGFGDERRRRIREPLERQHGARDVRHDVVAVVVHRAGDRGLPAHHEAVGPPGPDVAGERDRAGSRACRDGDRRISGHEDVGLLHLRDADLADATGSRRRRRRDAGIHLEREHRRRHVRHAEIPAVHAGIAHGDDPAGHEAVREEVPGAALDGRSDARPRGGVELDVRRAGHPDVDDIRVRPRRRIRADERPRGVGRRLAEDARQPVGEADESGVDGVRAGGGILADREDDPGGTDRALGRRVGTADAVVVGAIGLRAEARVDRDPRLAGIVGLVHATADHAGVHARRIARIEHDVGDGPHGELVVARLGGRCDEFDLREGLAAVDAAEDAATARDALLDRAGSVARRLGVRDRADDDDVLGADARRDDRRDRQARHVRRRDEVPGGAAVRRAHQPDRLPARVEVAELPGARVDDEVLQGRCIRHGDAGVVVRRDRDRADRERRECIGAGRPRHATVGRLPDAAVHRAGEDDVRVGGMHRDRLDGARPRLAAEPREAGRVVDAAGPLLHPVRDAVRVQLVLRADDVFDVAQEHGLVDAVDEHDRAVGQMDRGHPDCACRDIDRVVVARAGVDDEAVVVQQCIEPDRVVATLRVDREELGRLADRVILEPGRRAVDQDRIARRVDDPEDVVAIGRIVEDLLDRDGRIDDGLHAGVAEDAIVDLDGPGVGPGRVEDHDAHLLLADHDAVESAAAPVDHAGHGRIGSDDEGVAIVRAADEVAGDGAIDRPDVLGGRGPLGGRLDRAAHRERSGIHLEADGAGWLGGLREEFGRRRPGEVRGEQHPGLERLEQRLAAERDGGGAGRARTTSAEETCECLATEHGELPEPLPATRQCSNSAGRESRAMEGVRA